MSRKNLGRSGARRTGVTCFLGRHHYGEDHGIGAGILRRACSVCGAVTIDLTRAEEPSEPVVQTRHPITSLGSDR